jgi:hypothetical protein
LLRGRIEKPFEYFDEKDKDQVSDSFPKITHGQIFSAQVPWFVENKLDEVARLTHGGFSVLIISPIRSHARKLAMALRKRGFQNVEFADRPDKGINLMDGLKRLLANEGSNLGWRIASAALLDADSLKRHWPIRTATLLQLSKKPSMKTSEGLSKSYFSFFERFEIKSPRQKKKSNCCTITA